MKIRNPVVHDRGNRHDHQSHLAGGIRYPVAEH